jgi:hypothetical protein
MATMIRATCTDCGDVELGIRDLVVRLCEDTESGTYVFRCPRCSNPVVRSADRPTIDLLVSSGVRLELWTLPAELIEPRPIAPPLSHDDLLDFHELLTRKTWFDELLAAHRRFR